MPKTTLQLAPGIAIVERDGLWGHKAAAAVYGPRRKRLDGGLPHRLSARPTAPIRATLQTVLNLRPVQGLRRYFVRRGARARLKRRRFRRQPRPSPDPATTKPAAMAMAAGPGRHAANRDGTAARLLRLPLPQRIAQLDQQRH